jgi:hypothetical protein
MEIAESTQMTDARLTQSAGFVERHIVVIRNCPKSGIIANSNAGFWAVMPHRGSLLVRADEVIE